MVSLRATQSTSDISAISAQSSAVPAKKGQKVSGSWTWGQGFTAAVGALAMLQGVKGATARGPSPMAPALAPQGAPKAAPAPASTVINGTVPAVPNTTPPSPNTVPAVPVTSSTYEHCAYQLSSGSFACLQGLPLTQVQSLFPDTSSATCNNFVNILWSAENERALAAGEDTSVFSQAILFEVPESSECCAVYESTNQKGCLDLFPNQAECQFTSRSCVAFGYPSMKDIVAGVSPPAFNGAGICESTSTSGQIECIDETNVFIPAEQSGGGSSGGSSVQVSNGCSVNSETGVLTGTCTVNPTAALG